MKANLAPVSASNRIETLDVLRGLAIFGILVVNMQIFYQPLTSMMLGYQGYESGVSTISEFFIKFFFEGKFYVLFSFLFGYGFFLFMNKKMEGGGSILSLFRFRLMYLVLFGILHIVFLWPGDILLIYGLFGFMLILFRKRSDKALKIWAVCLAMLPLVLTGLFMVFISMAMKVPEAASQIEASFQESLAATHNLWERALAAYSSGSFGEVMNIRIAEYANITIGGLFFFYPVVLAMFLLGYLAGRKGLLQDIKKNLGFFRKSLWVGLIVGVPFGLVHLFTYVHANPMVMNSYSLGAMAGHTFGGFFIGLFYLSAVVLLINSGKGKSFSKWFAPVGKMALTNYILQSLVCTLIFNGYGLGLFGKIEPLYGILLSVFIFALQVPFSRWWLGRYNFGPLEWLWRSLTYRKLQPFKKA